MHLQKEENLNMLSGPFWIPPRERGLLGNPAYYEVSKDMEGMKIETITAALEIGEISSSSSSIAYADLLSLASMLRSTRRRWLFVVDPS
jgi:hypothetical protein